MTCSFPFRGAQGHNSLHDCTGRCHIGWKRGEVVPETNHARCAHVPKYTAHTAYTADAAYTCTAHTAHKTYTASATYTVYNSYNAAYAAHSKGLRPLPPTPRKNFERSMVGICFHDDWCTKFAFLKERVRKSRFRIRKNAFWNPRNRVLGLNVTPKN